MRIPDVNVLISAANTASPHNAAARSWIEQALSAAETVGLATVALLGFVRIVTNPRAVLRPLTPALAFDQLEQWLGAPSATVIHPGRRHFAICRELLEAAGTAGNLTTDAHLAALAIEHGASLASFDGDFHRFAGLDFEYLR